MPDKIRLLMQILADCVPRVVVTITAWEHYDADFHGETLS